MVLSNPIVKGEKIVYPSYEKNKGMVILGARPLRKYINKKVKVFIFKK